MRYAIELRAIEFAAAGAGCEEIATRLGVGADAVGRCLAKPENVALVGKFRAARMLRGLGVDFLTIGERVGLDYPTTLAACERVPVVGRYTPPAPPTMPTIGEQVHALRAQRYTIAEIAAHLGISINRVRAYGLPDRPPLPRGKLVTK